MVAIFPEIVPSPAPPRVRVSAPVMALMAVWRVRVPVSTLILLAVARVTVPCQRLLPLTLRREPPLAMPEPLRVRDSAPTVRPETEESSKAAPRWTVVPARTSPRPRSFSRLKAPELTMVAPV